MLKQDRWIIILIVLLWVLFFWRIFTPNQVDELSLIEGDFTRQFVSWMTYSVERFHAGEIPLWNPYAFAGTPFQADPQTAVFYPVRLVTIAILSFDSNLTASDIYFALEIEMTLHVLAGTLFMYLFLRQLTLPLSSLIGALIWGFGGYMTSYPLLQLPLLETAIWIPLILFGLHRATITKSAIKWNWLIFAGVIYAVSILAGHPQTFLLAGYLCVTYLIYRLWGLNWRKILLVLVIFAIIATGLAALQLLPTVDYQSQTTRNEIGLDERGIGFQWHEMRMILFPNIGGSGWNPMYIGIISLVLAGLAISLNKDKYWSGVLLFALILVFGQKTILYQAVYLVLPGFSFFRGQERTAVILTIAASVLAAYGSQALLSRVWTSQEKNLLWKFILGLALVCALFAGILAIHYVEYPQDESTHQAVQSTSFAFILSITSLFIVWKTIQMPASYWQWAIVGLLIFDLFSVNINNPTNYDPIPAEERLPEPEHISFVREHIQAGQQIEGLRGIRSGYSNLYSVPNIWGNNPLELENTHYFLWNLPIEKRWELLGVQLVYAEWDDIPAPNEKIGEAVDVEGHLNIFQLTNPRSFGLLYYDVQQVNSQDEAREALSHPELNLRQTVIIEDDLPTSVNIPDNAGNIGVVVFEPEYIELQAVTNEPAVASFTLPYVRGWHATVDGEDVEVFRTYGGLTGIYLEPGTHQIKLQYLPNSLLAGLVISGLTLLAVLMAYLYPIYQSKRRATIELSNKSQ